MIRINRKWPNIGQHYNISRLYAAFMKYNLNYVVVWEGKNLIFRGIIYRKELLEDYDANKISNFKTVSDLSYIYNKYEAIEETNDINSIKIKAKDIFRKHKELMVIPVVNSKAQVVYCIERDLLDKVKEENNLLYKYSVLQQYGYTIGKWLYDKKIKCVNLIGAPLSIVPIYNDLIKNNIIVKHIVDNQYFELGGKRSYRLEEMQLKDWEEVDANIILSIDIKNVLIDNLKVIGVTKTIYVISDIVTFLFEKATLYDEILNLIQNWIKKGANFEYFRYPHVSDILNKSKTEQFMFDNVIIPHDYRIRFRDYEELISKVIVGIDDSLENINKFLINQPVYVINKGDHIELQDLQSKYINVFDGKRVTTDCPDTYENVVYIIGPSWVFGKYEKDSSTLASNLQRKINEKNLKFKVINCGIPGVHWQKLIKNMSTIHAKKGDKIILVDCDNGLETFLKQHNIHINHDFSFIQRPHEHGEIFADKDHLNANGDLLFTDEIFKQCFVKSNAQIEVKVDDFNVKKEKLVYEVNYMDKIQWKFYQELENYIYKLPVPSKSINGAIVMNCNPFTNGHRYLVEKAAQQVETLYLFVVEEDKSFFPFQERLTMVINGVKDFKNVVVLTSSKFMISSITFPEYFLKEDLKEIVIDTSKDLHIFCKYIAPKLEIKKRFAGAEPLDLITAQYNKNMADILPDYGIDFIEIPRVENKGVPVSASLVRKYIRENEWEKIAELVPESTYSFLHSKYGGGEQQ